MNNRGATIKEVAKLADVSHMTVSRVLSNFPHVSPATRRKVLEACRKLQYRANLAAATLRGKKSHAIGVAIHTFRHTYYARLLNSIENACCQAGYHVIVIQGRYEKDSNKSFLTWEDFEFLFARQIDGLIIDLPLDNLTLLHLKKEGLPSVFTDTPAVGHVFSFVGTADFEGGREITRYLLRLGHRQIAFLAGPKNSYTSQCRLSGYRAALAEFGLNVGKNLIFYTNYNTDGGYETAKRLLTNSKISITAIVGANDYIAIGALAALAEKRIKVPEKISVVGFTGDEIGAFANPPLTTMFQPIEKIGRKAVEILLSLIKDPQRPAEKVLLPATLIERSSAAPPPT